MQRRLDCWHCGDCILHGRRDRSAGFVCNEVYGGVESTNWAPIQIVNVGDDLDHTTASTPSYIGAKAWFDSILEGS